MQPDYELGYYMLVLIVSMAISMIITPLMMRYATALKMVDEPDHRKVHTAIIPRVGGVGIVVGFLMPVMVFLQVSDLVLSVFIGMSILLAFGIWDDIKTLRPWIKFVGQVLATLSVVYYGDVWVHHFPLMGVDSIPEAIGKPFTVFAILGVINAVNLSDGLDGLAGGEVLISLIVIAYMLSIYDGAEAVTLAIAAIGGIFGFLRYNSHPAIVFMGDSGSQSLGFILAILVVHLTQTVNPVLSPALPVLLLGLPLIDSLVVFYMRYRRGDSLVVAAKDHLHHRLLALGFYHYESVMIIYTLQIAMVCAALLLPYASDLLVFVVYLLMCGSLYGLLAIAESLGWKLHENNRKQEISFDGLFRNSRIFAVLPARILDTGLSVFLIAACVMAEQVTWDIGISSILLLMLLLLLLIMCSSGKLDSNNQFVVMIYKMTVYVLIGFSVYLLSHFAPDWVMQEILLVYLFYAFLVMAIIIAVRASASEVRFSISPLDYLVVTCVVIFMLLNATGIYDGTDLLWVGMQMLVLFYAAEFLIERTNTLYNRFTGVLIVAMVILTIRGLL